MSANAAAPVAAPTADVSTATGGDPMDALFADADAAYPEQNFSADVVQQVGDGVTRATPAETIAIEDGQPTGAKPAAPEAPAAADQAEDDSVGEPYSIGPDGRWRGPDGKYSKKPEDKAAAEAKAADAAAAPKEPSPFRYRTQGETHAFEGATVHPETGDITIKAARAGVIREALNALHVRNVEHIPTIQKITDRNQALEAALVDAQSGLTLRETQAQAQLDRLDAALAEPDDQKFIEQMFRLREDRPKLMLEAEKSYWQKKAEGKASASPAKSATTAAPSTPAEGDRRGPAAAAALADEAVATVGDYVDSIAIEHEFRDITAEEWQQFLARAKRTPMAYVRPATAAHAKQHGVQEGESVFDYDLLSEDVKDYVSSLREQRAVATRREELAADRSRRTAPQVATPPSVSSGPPAPPAKKGDGFNSKQDVEDWWSSPTI